MNNLQCDQSVGSTIALSPTEEDDVELLAKMNNFPPAEYTTGFHVDYTWGGYVAKHAAIHILLLYLNSNQCQSVISHSPGCRSLYAVPALLEDPPMASLCRCRLLLDTR